MDRTSTPMVNQATCVDDGRDERRRGEGSEHGDGDDFHKARIGQEKTRLFAIRSEMREWNHHAHDADRRQAPRHTGLDTQSTISALPSLVCQVQLLARRRRSGRRTLGPWVCRRRESAGGDSDRKKRRVEHSRSVARSNTGATVETLLELGLAVPENCIKCQVLVPRAPRKRTADGRPRAPTRRGSRQT